MMTFSSCPGADLDELVLGSCTSAGAGDVPQRVDLLDAHEFGLRRRRYSSTRLATSPCSGEVCRVHVDDEA